MKKSKSSINKLQLSHSHFYHFVTKFHVSHKFDGKHPRYDQGPRAEIVEQYPMWIPYIDN